MKFIFNKSIFILEKWNAMPIESNWRHKSRIDKIDFGPRPERKQECRNNFANCLTVIRTMWETSLIRLSVQPRGTVLSLRSRSTNLILLPQMPIISRPGVRRFREQDHQQDAQNRRADRQIHLCEHHSQICEMNESRSQFAPRKSASGSDTDCHTLVASSRPLIFREFPYYSNNPSFTDIESRVRYDRATQPNPSSYVDFAFW